VADDRSVDVNQPTDSGVPVDSLDALINEAIVATRVLPTIDRCQQLDHLLRQHISVLMPVVQAQADGLSHGDTAWYGRQRLLDHTTTLLTEDLGSGLVSAARHVQELARHCAGLARYAGQ